MKRSIRLPNGKACSLRTYCAAWRTLLTVDANASIKGWDHFPERADRILREIRYGVHDRINKHDPAFGRGRKWQHLWQTEVQRMARDVNTPRLVVHWVPKEFRGRLAHRTTKDC